MTFALDQFTLNGKVAIITGVGGRKNSIGEAYAKGLAAAGAAIVAADINYKGAKSVAESLTADGKKAIAVELDITDPNSAKRLAESAAETFGGIDILVNNAALMVEIQFEPVIATSLENWNKVMAVNVTGALNCCQAVVPFMRKRGGGKIVNQVSAGAFPPASLYGISKLALVGLTATLAKELGPDKINVNAIAPGVTGSDAGNSLTPPDSPLIQMLDTMAAMRVRGMPDELVGALLLLTSTAGDWITGQVLHVDGGWVLRP